LEREMPLLAAVFVVCKEGTESLVKGL